MINMKTPICLNIDDFTVKVSVYHAHARARKTQDGRELVPFYTKELFFEFCKIVEAHGIKGKLSLVPMPGNLGDIINGIKGVSDSELKEWLSVIKSRLVPQFTICPEMLTHNKAVDLKTGVALELNERDWASTQNRETLTPYISKALSILKEAGIKAVGVTSPWDFGIEVENEYAAAISRAVYDVSESENSWYFLRGLRDVPNAKPWVALEEDDRTVVSIPATTRDKMWQTINTTRTDREFISSVADELITENASDGEIVRVLNTGGYPIIVTHWQSLMSNGLGTGLRVLDEVARRINKNLSEKVEWTTYEDVMKMVLKDKKSYPKPKF
jgi:hypothetical protein